MSKDKIKLDETKCCISEYSMVEIKKHKKHFQLLDVKSVEGVRSRLFLKVKTSLGTNFCDVITGTLYCAETGRCVSSNQLELVL